jgi:hypothetical protein
LKKYEIKKVNISFYRDLFQRKDIEVGLTIKIDFEEKYNQSKSQNLKMEERRKKDGELYFLVAISFMAKVEEIKL